MKPTKQGYLVENIYLIPQQTIKSGLYTAEQLENDPIFKYDTEFFQGEKFVYFEGKGWRFIGEEPEKNIYFDDDWADEHLIGVSKYYED
jgi:hypothetical protein